MNLFCDIIFGVRMKNLLNLLTSKGLLKNPTSSIKGSHVKKLSKVFFSEGPLKIRKENPILFKVTLDFGS